MLKQSMSAAFEGGNNWANGFRCGDEIKRFFNVFLGIQDRMVFGT
jgi:hypothetical protein